jgi:hypothetical protein
MNQTPKPMYHNSKTPDRLLRRDGRWAALKRLEEAIERNTGDNCNAEKIRLLRRVYFADVEEFAESEMPEIPK